MKQNVVFTITALLSLGARTVEPATGTATAVQQPEFRPSQVGQKALARARPVDALGLRSPLNSISLGELRLRRENEPWR
jgi:hypothetical protein